MIVRVTVGRFANDLCLFIERLTGSQWYNISRTLDTVFGVERG